MYPLCQIPLIRSCSLLRYIVRTPLNSIINYLEIILDGQIDEGTREQLGKSLIYAINDLLDLTRVTGNDPILLAEIFNSRHEIDSVIDAFREEAIRKALSLSTHLKTDMLPSNVRGDPMRLRQAVSNILSNALEHTERGNISIKIDVLEQKYSEALVELTIQDEGSGMSEAQLDSLFQHLEHIMEVSELHVSEGDESPLGLGLAVVARFVRNCQGQLRIRSELGKGTKVHFRMPLTSASASHSDKTTLDTPPSDQTMADLL